MLPNNGHSIFSPSKAHRYMKCPGSIAMEAGAKDDGSTFAQEGTCAHKLSEMVLRGEVASASEMLNESIMWEEGGKKISWKINADMIDHVQRYVDRIRERVEEFKMLPNVKKVTLHVEQRVDFSDLIGIPGQSGTADIVIEVEFDDDTAMLSVEDLKYGMGVKVDAEANEQLMTYGAAVMSAFELVGYDIVKVNVAIHQIRLNHLSEYTYTADEIREFTVELAKQAKVAEAGYELYTAGKITTDELVLKPGEKQCKFCKAKGKCPALANAVMTTIVNDFDDFDTAEEPLEPLVEMAIKDLGEVSVVQLSRYMQVAGLIEDWLKSVRARVEAEIFNGNKVPGYKLVEGKRGNRAWSDKEAAEEALKAMRLKLTEMYEMSLISPTTAEKLLKETPRRWKKLQSLITRSEGRPSVAPESDKRPALVLPSVSEDFDDLNNGEDLC